MPEQSGGEALIVSDGPMMNGLETPAERVYNDAIQALEAARLEGGQLPGGLIRKKRPDEYYASVEEYDPVLRWHCRL
jgi:hypothetical protein